MDNKINPSQFRKHLPKKTKGTKKRFIKNIITVEAPTSAYGYNVIKMADELAVRRENLTADKMVALIKEAKRDQMLIVRTHMGTTVTHVEKSQTTGRFTGYNGSKLVTFHPNNVKEYYIVTRTSLPDVVTTVETEIDFAYF